jgi:hypothetical protein
MWKSLFVSSVLSFLAVASACTGLSFRGGGSFGAVEVGMLAALLESGTVPASVDLFTGISAGGLNAGFLASNMATGATLTESVGALGELYASLTDASVYSFHPLKSFSSWSFYQTTPLNATISNTLSAMIPGRGTVPRTLIGTSDLETGLLEVVEYDQLVGLEEKVAALMATSAIPMVFPPVAWNGSLYVDGGLVSNEILFQALRFFDCTDPVLWFFEPSVGIVNVPQIPTFGAYLHRVLSMAFSGFDSQLQKLLVNPRQGCGAGHKSITLQVCHPNDTGIAELAGYSILEFGNGKTLYGIGRDTVVCDTWLLCV